MKSAILYPYGPLRANGCCRMLHAKHLALTSAIYTLNISILVVLLYSWRISVNVKRYSDLEDVYYGVQIAYFAIIGTQCSMVLLSIVLMFGIYKENIGLVVPWIIGFITFMALEAVAMVYSNVLRDHVNRQFDSLCKAEVAFFVSRAFINALAMWAVTRFYNLLRAGVTWKGPEVIELWHNSNDTEKTLASLRDETHLIVRIRGTEDDCGNGGGGGRFSSTDEDDDDDGDGGGGAGGIGDDGDDTDDNMIDASGFGSGRGRRARGRTRQLSRDGGGGSDDGDKSAGSGSDEDDSLLVAYDSNSVASVWQYRKLVRTMAEFQRQADSAVLLFLIIFCIEVYAQIFIFF